MFILLTNHRISQRTGTELYVGEVGLDLLARGHRVAVYTPNPGPLAEALREEGLPVTDRLETLAARPDVIHGQHHLPAAAAALAFPDVPVFLMCHGFLPWEEKPVLLPNIVHHGATSNNTRDLLCLEYGIPENRVSILPTYVDTRKFARRDAPLPARPRRALVYTNYLSPGKEAEALEKGCAQVGVEVEFLGRGFGNTTPHPERILGQFDLVFGAGRSILEAAATGAAIVLLGEKAMGENLTCENFETLQSLNFGLRAMRHPIHEREVAHRIRAYDAEDAAGVCCRIREEATLSTYVDRLVNLYEELADRGVPAPDPGHGMLLTGRYLEWLARELSRQERAPHEKEATRMSRLLQELAAEKARNRALQERVARLKGGG